MKSILIVESDRVTATVITQQFEQQGYTVYNAYRGEAVTRMVIRNSPDCVMVNLKLPDKSGFDVIVELKRFYQGPIVLLSAHSTVDSEVTGFKLGADDFIAKTVAFPILLQRVKRLVSKPTDEHEAVAVGSLTVDQLIIDKKCYSCQYSGSDIQLTNEEFELLYYLAAHKNHLLTRDNIYRTLKGVCYDGISRGIDIAISRIRYKLAKAGATKQLIMSVRGKGYMLKSNEDINQQPAATPNQKALSSQQAA